jgi:hypothetical protein
LIPPLPPQWASGGQKCGGQCLPWSPGPSIFRSFFRFDFCLDFGLVLGPFWARLGRLLGPFGEPKSGQVGSKIRLEPSFVRKWRCSKNIGKRKARATFLTPRWAQDRLKTGPRRVQERSKSHACFVLIFDSFWGRLGVVLGPILGSKIVPKSLRRFRVDRLDIDLVIDWSQDGLKTAPRGLLGGFLGRLGGVLGRSWGLLGPLWRVLGGF